MALFHCKLSSRTTFTVEYHIPTPRIAPPTLSQTTKLHVPFEPDTASLQSIDIDLHTISTFPAFLMSDEINTWFSQCFGYEVVLAYTGDALGIKKGDDLEQSWLSSMQAIIPKQIDAVRFSDGAALLIASDASLEDVHTRLPHGEESVLEKFRPNIVVDGEGKAWDEDFWAELTILPLGAKLMVIANCARCTSINVDLEKGRMGEGESGKLLKKLMKDRRIDLGDKWSPIFGRYAFPLMGGEIAIGDEVMVTKRNDEHTVWSSKSGFQCCFRERRVDCFGKPVSFLGSPTLSHVAVRLYKEIEQTSAHVSFALSLSAVSFTAACLR